ncbi:MAG TPA: DUF1674 domain-containing protein [Rhizomicrobium sp.]
MLPPPSVKPMTANPRKPSKAQIADRIREAGERARAEAEERRKAAQPQALPRELGGPKGPEPTRYGDWEKKGITSDF